MTHTMPPQFRKNLLALALGAALAPTASWALELVQEPPLPTSKSAFVAPNVIISIDDSGSMRFRSDEECDNSYQYPCSDGKNPTEEKWPNSSGVWPPTARRINVLKHSLNKVFSDKTLIPDDKIRIAWQAMHNNGKSSGAGSVNSSSMNTNSMRLIGKTVAGTTTHRDNFLDFVKNTSPNNGTPSHKMFSQADGYMRQPLTKNSPWSSDPGGTGSKSTEYLGCRRNYHIMMTDGRWTDTASGENYDGKSWSASGNRQAYSTNSNQTLIYRDTIAKTLADWAFYSWMEPLQTSGLTDADKLKPSKIYEDALATKNFSVPRKTAEAYQICNKYENVCVKPKKNGCDKYENQCTGGWTTIPAVFETKSVDLQKYWNPEYNPATWPHMVTYTIGFSDSAIEWPGAPTITKPTLAAATSETDKGGYFGYDKGFADLVTGWETWPDMNISNTGNEAKGSEVRSLDLWHAAINGRGRFYPVTKGEDLENAFRSIIGKINEESAALPDKIAAGGASSGYNISQNNAGLFGTVYNPKDGWSGSITATPAREPEEYACPSKEDPKAKCLRFPNPIAEWDGKTTAQRLDDLASVDNRLILTWSDKWASTKATGGVPFKWATDESNLSAAQKALLGKETSDTTATVATKGANILNFIRGDRSLEGSTDDKPFRVRTSRQGDIVNSDIWYTADPISSLTLSGYSAFAKTHKDRLPMLYVGGNDGMLHGFSAKDGNEKLAYVPRGVIANLKQLTDPNYQHKYYVDGSPMTGDVKDSDGWKTLLVGTLGAGGKGYFVLDVTNPSTFATATPSSLVVMDRTRGNNETVNCSALTGAEKTACTNAVNEDADIGNITAQPVRNPTNLQEATQIARLNNDRWAVVLGNGYNSTNQRPVLLVQYLDGSKELKRIQATTDAKPNGNANDNGLAAPTLVDLDGNGKVDVVYAGDNLGNLWKFDLTSTDEAQWKVAFGGIDNNNPGSGKPLFTTRGPATLTSTTRDKVQPITAPPIVRPNDRKMTTGTGKDAKTVYVGGFMVAFGTGRNLTSDDRRTDITHDVQTLYSVLDNTSYRMNTAKTSLEVHPGDSGCTVRNECVPPPASLGTIANDGKPLAKQTITTVSGEFATVDATTELKTDTWKTYKGWYLDLPFKGERLLKPMQFYDGSNILAVYTESPSGTKSSTSDNINESCVPVKIDTSAGSQWRTLINIMDGKRPSIPLVDMNDDGVFNSADKNVSRIAVSTGSPLLITTPKNILDYTGKGTDPSKAIKGARMPEQSMRPSWRQLR